MAPRILYHYYEDGEKAVFYKDKSRKEILLDCPVRERLDAAAEDTVPEQVLVYRNETYLAVFPSITDYGRDQRPSFIVVPNVQLYRKP